MQPKGLHQELGPSQGGRECDHLTCKGAVAPGQVSRYFGVTALPGQTTYHSGKGGLILTSWHNPEVGF